MTTALWAIALVLGGTFLGAFGALFLKKGSANFSFSLTALLTNYYLIGGIFLYGISTFPFIAALRGGELSVLYPLVSLGYVWIALLSNKILGEKISTVKWIGIALIMLGVFALGRA